MSGLSVATDARDEVAHYSAFVWKFTIILMMNIML